MADRQFEDPRTAALYDPLDPRDSRADFAFYLPMILAASNTLDVGCGTGALLHWARERGHSGRLVGLDPANGMLAIARTRTDIEWIQGDLNAAAFDGEFDFVVMSGHAFQVFVSDDELDAALRAIHVSLADGGVFGFETRNPAARAWDEWTADYRLGFVDSDGTPAWFTAQVEGPVVGGVVGFESSYQRADWAEPEYSRSTLRFLDVGQLGGFLDRNGFAVLEQFGDWDRSPLSELSPEIITLAAPR